MSEDYERARRLSERAAELGLMDRRPLELPGYLVDRAYRLGIDLEAAALRGLAATLIEREGGSHDDLDHELERVSEETERYIAKHYATVRRGAD